MNSAEILALAALSLASSAIATQPSLADDFICTSTLGETIVENLRVPEGETCTLQKTSVEGNILVEANATLMAHGVRIEGNIQAENALAVEVNDGSVVEGNIQIKQSGSANILDSQIGGDLQFEENQFQLTAEASTIGGNLQAFMNFGPLAVFSNRIDGNLQCEENSPTPTGAGNVVSGEREGQCARF